jgi:chitinase
LGTGKPGTPDRLVTTFRLRAYLVSDVAAQLPSLKPDVKVFVSIGGWTFSDNDTATQPVFGNISRSASNRQKLADNLLKFMTGYGFDGVDLDW